MRFKLFIITLIFLATRLNGQIVSLDPTFPSQTDTVTITYDATQGNGALEDVSEVYAHMGLITEDSQSPSDWRYVVGEWGTADPDTKMENIGNNKHTKTYDIADFHNIPEGETVLKLAFVFRNADGSIVGRDTDGGDIFVDLFQGDYAAAIISPTEDALIVENGDTIEIKSSTSTESTIKISIDGNVIDSATSVKDLISQIPVNDFGKGKFWVKMTAENGINSLADSFYYVYPDTVSIENPPAGLVEGLNIINDTTVIFNLFAPYKDYAFLLGDFSNWELDTDYFMKRSEDGIHFWLEVNGLDPDKEYRFQYQIEESLRIADIYSEKILDPWNDPFIPEDLYPNLTPYPVGLTNEPVSTFKINKSEYQWDNSINYTRPDKEKLVVYEVLLRDFVEDHSYRALRDTLDYLERLGINAIELMPINEFEGNDSWGYNPSFYFAPDKYYGTQDDLKSLIEECHRRGIAVILDMALNHSFGQNPQVRMYFDPAAGGFGQPTAQSPWFNQVAKHDFNVGYDYNHESVKTQEFVDRVLAFWLEEYRIDGYRMDLSKGFTQVNSLGDIGKWGQRDPSRIAIWKRIKEELNKVDPDVIMILEHFADNNEEKELSDLGFMLWGNCNHSYDSPVMGFGGSLGCISYKNRSWNNAHLVGYMESHDEERLMYKNINSGNSSNEDHDVKEFENGIMRLELATNFFLTVPGPKMIWQFGEFGYDFSINRCTDGSISGDCRLTPKPIRWDYKEDSTRLRLYNVYSELNRLRREYEVFHTDNFQIEGTSDFKELTLIHPDMNVYVVGNFGIDDIEEEASFPETGMWYEFYTQDSMSISDVNLEIKLYPGEYRLYSNKRIEGMFNDEVAERPIDLSEVVVEAIAYPNPFNSAVVIGFRLDQYQQPVIKIFDAYGKEIRVFKPLLKEGYHEFTWDASDWEGDQVPSGQYIIKIETAGWTKELNVVLVI